MKTAESNRNKQQQQQQKCTTQAAFRPDFCSPAYLNSLLRQQHLHWLEIRRRAQDSCSLGAVTQFLFVIPSSLSNLVCVIGTEAPILEAQLGCRLRRSPNPDYIAPDGLLTFSVDYADEGSTTASSVNGGAHAKFIAALKKICVRLQLTNICLGPTENRSCGDSSGGGSAGCLACYKVRTHTKTVRGTSAAPRLTRQPQLAAPPPPIAPSKQSKLPAADKSAEKDQAAARMAESVAEEIIHRLPTMGSAIRAATTATTSTWLALRHCQNELMNTSLAHCSLYVGAVGIFSDWAGPMADRLIACCASLLARAVVLSHAAASSVTDAAAHQLIRYIITGPLLSEMVAAERTLFRACLLCDQPTSRLLLIGQQPLRRRCPGCGASFTAARSAGLFGGAYQLTVKSRRAGVGSCHASLLHLADCARGAKDASLGSLLLQRIASLPSNY